MGSHSFFLPLSTTFPFFSASRSSLSERSCRGGQSKRFANAILPSRFGFGDLWAVFDFHTNSEMSCSPTSKLFGFWVGWNLRCGSLKRFCCADRRRFFVALICSRGCFVLDKDPQ